MMKKAAIFLMFFILKGTLTTYAQKDEVNNQKSQLGVIFSALGKCDIMSFQKSVGGAGYKGDKYFSLGLIYLYSLNKTLDLETGIEYSNYKIIITPNLPPQMDNTPHTENFSLIDIPLTLRVNFLKYCFINGGVGLDMDAGKFGTIDSQTGIGVNLGLGLKYSFKIGLSVFANPYFKVHSLISFSSVENPQRLMESGFKFGLIYRFNKLKHL
jgi:hypothetical protein